MDPRRRKLEGLRRWRQAAVWSPVLGLPLVLYWLLTARPLPAVGLVIAGACFWGLARAVVWSARCPGCERPFREARAGFRHIWDQSQCASCGLSLFELRRGGTVG
jgi:hypothetical protein